MGQWIDIKGQRFGKLVALRYLGASKWEFRCDCGKLTTALMYHAKTGNTTSCGCWKRAVLGVSTTKHGKVGTRTYRIWKGMRNRCNNKNSQRYKDYGGRGVTVCRRWDKFENFLTDMGEAPDGKSLDRVDNDKGYSKRNCRWATPTEQADNTRQFRIRLGGLSLKDVATQLGLTYWGAYHRYKKGLL